ncbi:MAG TPA: ComF family protein [Gammaproteobacteria bacterium]|nr:ComF family protein [Gammaproteobacteria bacterium]
MTKVNKWANSIQTLLFPSRCVLCGDSGTQNLDLCRGCLAELPRNNYSCHTCALPLSADSGEWQCGACQKKTPAYDRCHAPLHYRYPVDHLLTQLKFHQKLVHARLLGTLMARWLTQPVLPELLVPVPLHSSRLRERGYNQALELARPIAKQLRLPIDSRICHRTNATAAQSGLNLEQRRTNMRNAFVVTGNLQAKHIAIIDDVVTTGHTVNEMARVLRRAGAERIDIWACARASLHH